MIGDNNDLGVALVTFLPLLFYLWQRYPQPYFKWPLLGWIVLVQLVYYGVLFREYGSVLSAGFGQSP